MLSLLAVSGVARAQTVEEPALPDGEDQASKPTSWWRSAYRSSQDLLDRLNDEGFFPQLKSFSDNTGPALGVVYWKPRLGGAEGTRALLKLGYSF